MITDNEQVYIEKDCTFDFQGRTFESGGAIVTPDYAIGYLKFEHGEYIDAGGILTTWKGDYLGSANIKAKWRVYSNWGNYMYQVLCVINGIMYTGRSFGSGMIWKGKRVKNQR